MATWYSPTNPDDDSLWLYSERGVMSYLFAQIWRELPERILEIAETVTGETLGQRVGELRKFRVLTEFELGNLGFGSPDGALMIQNNDHEWHFVFIETKRKSWVDSSEAPTTRNPEQLKLASSSQLNSWCERNKFNSSINGQLEMRCRFVNAFRNSIHSKSTLVIEREVPEVLMNCDRFYWRRQLNPDVNRIEDWRRVEMGADLRPLWKALESVSDRFYYLAITNEEVAPDMSTVRLFDSDGERMAEESAQTRLFWMSLSHLTNRLRAI